MRNAALIFVGFFFLTPALNAQTGGEFAVAGISPELRKNANAVLRMEDMRFEITANRQTITTYHYAVTILNENGDDWAEFSEYYDKFREIESVEGVLYDANGKQLKKVKKKDLEDLSGSSGSSLIDDNRIKRHNFYYKVYPYTIEYISEITNKGSLFFPGWIPQGGERLSVQSSEMHIVCPADYQFRYKAFLYKGEPVVTEEKTKKVSTWSAKNMPAIIKEPYSPLWHELTTVVIFGPSEFRVDSYAGNMVTWQDFGKFVYSLKQGRDQLPPDVIKTVHQVADGTSDPVEKITRLYQFMQSNTRYVGIQLGIGGWQPFDATYVATKKYGDCKALANYMYSILKEVGVLSYYTLIRAGEFANYITTDFPSQQFNHVILCVPLQKDTMWLECTSQTIQAGYLGDFTCDRPALLIDENGGKLVRTPKYGIKDNLQDRHIKALLDETGNLSVKANTRYSGLQQDDIHGMITQLSKDKVKEFLHEQFDFATYDINRFEYNEEKKSLPAINESLDISVSNYATITGKRLFIVPNVMTRTHRKISMDTARKYDIQLASEYKDTDTVEIELPKGYETEAIPKDVSITSSFGKYNSSVRMDGNRIFYYRSVEQYSGRFPAKDYQDMVKFYEAVYKADRNKIVLVKNETPLKAF